MPVTLTPCRETVRVFNNRNFSFNEKSNFNSRINRVVIPHTVLIRKNLSILNNIQLLPILVSAFLSLNYKYCNTAGHFRLHIFVSTCILVVLHIWSYYIFVLSKLLLSGDIEMNPGPKLISRESFSIYHWNLNSIPSHDYTKIFFFRAYKAVYKFETICSSETYLESEKRYFDQMFQFFFENKLNSLVSTLTNNDNIGISGYDLVRSDHASNTKRGGVCI